eukprot:285281-Rhodomonas_salina.1
MWRPASERRTSRVRIQETAFWVQLYQEPECDFLSLACRPDSSCLDTHGAAAARHLESELP